MYFAVAGEYLLCAFGGVIDTLTVKPIVRC